MANALTEMLEIQIERTALGQVLSGLETLAEQWEGTSAFLRGDESAQDACIRECSSAEEASRIAGWYREIIHDLERQFVREN